MPLFSPSSLSDFDYTLPEELVAQRPLEKRSDSRLLIVRKNPEHGEGRFEDLQMCDLADFIKSCPRLKNARAFRNRSKVFPARFYCRRKSGSHHEIVLLEEIDESRKIWKAITKNSRRFHYPEELILENDPKNRSIRALEEGHVDLSSLGDKPLQELSVFAEMPLPPYIRDRNPDRDRDRYQAVWAQSEKLGSAAAPTASLHFDESLLQKLNPLLSFHDLYLHVGLGTFEALRHDQISDNRLHSEKIEIPTETVRALEGQRPPRNLAIGTTALRSMESYWQCKARDPRVQLETDRDGSVRGRSELFITPGYHFKATDALLTNFHLPKSSLFILICAFADSLALAKEAYQHAIRQKYRFFSYGDASLWF